MNTAYLDYASGWRLGIPAEGNAPRLLLEELSNLQEVIPQTRIGIKQSVRDISHNDLTPMFWIRIYTPVGTNSDKEVYDRFADYINSNL